MSFEHDQRTIQFALDTQRQRLKDPVSKTKRTY